MHTKFTSIVALALTAFAALTLAAPVLDKRDYLAENAPWRLRDITVFTAAGNSTSNSTVAFRISDGNPGLEFKTKCRHEVLPAATLTDSMWHRCQNRTVGFKYNGGDIQISRSYRDPAVAGGTNMDTVTCFGSNATAFTSSRTPEGVYQRMRYMEVYCTIVVA